MYYKEIMSSEEKQQAKDIFLKSCKGTFVLNAVQKIPIMIGLLISVHLIRESRFTHSRWYFMMGWSFLPMFIYCWFYSSKLYKRTKPLKKLRKTDKQFADTLMDEIIIDDEKITINENFSILYKDVKTASFAKGFVAVIDKHKQPAIIKLSDERQIHLYSILSDRKRFRKKKNFFVTLDNPANGYYIPEIEEKRKVYYKKERRKNTIITIAIGLVALAFSTSYVLGHIMEDAITPDIEYTYTEGEDLHDMLEKAVVLGDNITPVLDVYTDYADKEYDSYIKSKNGEKGVNQIKVYFPLDDDNIYILEITDDTRQKERTVSYGQFTDKKNHMKELFEYDYIQEEYPVIADYLFWTMDGWKFTLKDARALTFNDEGIYRFTEDSVSFEGKGKYSFTVKLENSGESGLKRAQYLFEQLEQECKKPYKQQDIDWDNPEEYILQYIEQGY